MYDHTIFWLWHYIDIMCFMADLDSLEIFSFLVTSLYRHAWYIYAKKYIFKSWTVPAYYIYTRPFWFSVFPWSFSWYQLLYIFCWLFCILLQPCWMLRMKFTTAKNYANSWRLCLHSATSWIEDREEMRTDSNCQVWIKLLTLNQVLIG